MDSIIELSHLKKSFGENDVLHDISFSINHGDVISVIGSSGSGKSTMLRCINLLETPTEGKIFFHGQDIQSKAVSLTEYRSKVTMVFQNFNLFNNMTAFRNCTIGTEKVLGVSKEEAEARAEKYLSKVGMAAYKNANPRQLSGGQKQRVAIARALCMEPEVILFDEPTSALDPVGRKEILDVLCKVKEYTTVIFSTHILSDVERICDEIAFLHEGNIVLKGELSEIKNIRKTSSVQIECFNEADVSKVLKVLPEGKLQGRTSIIFENVNETNMCEMMSHLAENSIAIQKIEMIEPTLEDLFVEVVSK